MPVRPTVAHPAGQELAGLFLELAAWEFPRLSPVATKERALWRDSHLKAKLPFLRNGVGHAKLGIRACPSATPSGLAASAP